MGDEPRRSGRATKGQNPKIQDQSLPVAKKAKKQTTKREVSPDQDDGDAIIRCICGANVEDSDDERMMVCCDQCSSWQHNECMEIPEDEDELPEKYLCEVCDPASHKELLDKVARGERPWEERAKERERQEQEKKDRKKKGGKKGKGGKKAKTSEVKSKDGEVANDDSTMVVEEAEPVKEINPQTAPSEIKDKAGETKSKTGDTKNKAGDTKSKESVQKKSTQQSESSGSNKRKARSESANGRATDAGKEPQPKARKLSVSKPKDKRSSSSHRKPHETTPSKRESRDKHINQTELVSNVEELRNEVRRRSADVVIKTIAELIPKAQSAGAYQVPEWTTAINVATRLGLEVEHAVHIHHSNVPGDPTSEYRQRLRSMIFNVKRNSVLRDGLLQGSLTPEKFSTMTTDEMASQEQRERDAEMIKEAEKQHIMIKEEGPRIRRTHKGEEIVGADMDGTSDSVPTGARSVRPRRESGIEDDSPIVKSPPGSAMSPTSPFSSVSILEGRRESKTDEAGSPTMTKSLNDEPKTDSTAPTIATNLKSTPALAPFNIQDVWSSVHGQGSEKKQRPTLQTLQTTSTEVAEVEHPNVAGIDPEIDQLLKDEEVESPPYSPTDYTSDPSTIWRGKVGMFGVAEFFASAKHVAGPNLSHVVPWSVLMPHHIRIDFRIPADRANRYLCELRFSRTTDIIIVGLSPTGGSEGQAEFEKMWHHFETRQKYGVVRNLTSSSIRDVYVIPLEAGMTELPVFMEMLEEINLEKPRPERMILITYVLKSPHRPYLQPQTPATPSNGTGATITAVQPNPSEVAPDTSIVSAGPAASPITPHPTQNNPSMSFPPQQNATAVSSSDTKTAEQILGRFINASVIKQLLSQSPDIHAVQLNIIKEILEKVPEAGEDFELLSRLLMEKSRAEGH